MKPNQHLLEENLRLENQRSDLAYEKTLVDLELESIKSKSIFQLIMWKLKQ